MNENSFSLVSEKSPVQDGSVHHFAKNDFRVVKRLFDFDFHPIEKALGIDCFSTISNYKAVAKKERMYNRNVSAMVQRISRSIETAPMRRKSSKSSPPSIRSTVLGCLA